MSHICYFISIPDRSAHFQSMVYRRIRVFVYDYFRVSILFYLCVYLQRLAPVRAFVCFCLSFFASVRAVVLGNLFWLSYLMELFGSPIWKPCLESLFENHVWKATLETLFECPDVRSRF